MLVTVDYGLGNLGSMANMLRRIGVETIVTGAPKIVASATRLILPGVGAFDTGMQNLRERQLIPVLNRKVLDEKVPILGVCLGMQLFARSSEEGTERGLGWLEADTVRFRFEGRRPLPVPHMGWNTLTLRRQSALLDTSDPETRFYFVHSYHLQCRNAEDILATTSYGYDFPSVVERGNVVGTQFHPEKSHKFGMQVLKRFVESC